MHSSSKEKMHGSPGMWCIQALREDALITWDVMHSSSTEKMHCLPGMWCIQSLHGWPTACPGGKILKSKHNFLNININVLLLFFTTYLYEEFLKIWNVCADVALKKIFKCFKGTVLGNFLSLVFHWTKYRMCCSSISEVKVSAERFSPLS